MNKESVFSKELEYIKDERLKRSAVTLIEMLPDYFFTIPASSTGKYHPEFSQNEGGLVRHTKAAVRIAYELLKSKVLNNFTDNEKDLIIIALIVHDGLKKGVNEEKWTKVEHPLLIANFIKNNKDKLEFTDDEINLLYDMTSCHMGEFNTDFKGNEVLPLPKTKYARFVNMCDLLSSKKFLNIHFDSNNNIEY